MPGQHTPKLGTLRPVVGVRDLEAELGATTAWLWLRSQSRDTAQDQILIPSPKVASSSSSSVRHDKDATLGLHNIQNPVRVCSDVVVWDQPDLIRTDDLSMCISVVFMLCLACLVGLVVALLGCLPSVLHAGLGLSQGDQKKLFCVLRKRDYYRSFGLAETQQTFMVASACSR